MRLFVSTVVAVVVLALWLPVTADFDYAVTTAEYTAHGKSFSSLLFATCAVAYSAAGLLRFGGRKQAPRHRFTKPVQGQLRPKHAAKGGSKRSQKKPAKPMQVRQLAPAPVSTGLEESLMAESTQADSAANTVVPAPTLSGAAGLPAAVPVCGTSKRHTRRRSACKKVESCTPALAAVAEDADAATAELQSEQHAAAEEKAAATEQEDASSSACGEAFTMVPCGRRYHRPGQPLLLRTCLLPSSLSSKAAKQLQQPLGRLITIEEQLPRLQRRLEYVPGEGDCQFCSVAMLLEGCWKNHLLLRQQVCDHIADNEALFAPFTSSSSLSSYLYEMRQPCSWGDELTLTAMADLLRRELRVVTDYHEGEQGGHTYMPVAGPAVDVPLYMWFRNGHYNPLLPQ